MNFIYTWVTFFMIVYVGQKATISRSPHVEMKQIKEAGIIAPRINLDEYWPFPKTLSEGDPYVYEVEKKITITLSSDS